MGWNFEDLAIGKHSLVLRSALQTIRSHHVAINLTISASCNHLYDTLFSALNLVHKDFVCRCGRQLCGHNIHMPVLFIHTVSGRFSQLALARDCK